MSVRFLGEEIESDDERAMTNEKIKAEAKPLDYYLKLGPRKI